jgi:hypothetical protein
MKLFSLRPEGVAIRSDGLGRAASVGWAKARRAVPTHRRKSEWIEYSDTDQLPHDRAQNTVVGDATVFASLPGLPV